MLQFSFIMVTKAASDEDAALDECTAQRHCQLRGTAPRQSKALASGTEHGRVICGLPNGCSRFPRPHSVLADMVGTKPPNARPVIGTVTAGPVHQGSSWPGTSHAASRVGHAPPPGTQRHTEPGLPGLVVLVEIQPEAKEPETFIRAGCQ